MTAVVEPYLGVINSSEYHCRIWLFYEYAHVHWNFLTVGIFITNQFIRDQLPQTNGIFSSSLNLKLLLEFFFLIQDFAYEAS